MTPGECAFEGIELIMPHPQPCCTGCKAQIGTVEIPAIYTCPECLRKQYLAEGMRMAAEIVVEYSGYELESIIYQIKKTADGLEKGRVNA